MQNKYAAIIVICLTLFLGCQKSKLSTFTIVQTSAIDDFSSLEVFGSKIFATSGSPWGGSNISMSTDSYNWNTEYLTDRGMFDIHAQKDDLILVGNSGYILTGTDDFTKNDFDNTNMLRAFTNVSTQYIAIGGKDFNKGWIYPLDSTLTIKNEFLYDHELSDVKCDSQGNCIVTGYGIILHSNNTNESWNRSSQTGDFYTAVAYNANNIPFVVGYSGSIMSSMDKGQSWELTKNGHSPINKNHAFRMIRFYENIGFIIGDDGTIWRSMDNGSSWEDISIESNLDLFDFVLYDNSLIIGSEMGQIIRVTL